jgi:tetratricopeptide (TPR) repeat protein
MSIDPGLLNEIENYLRDELTAPEKKAFEEKIKQDPLLAQEVDNYRTAVFLIKAGAVQTLKKKLEQYSGYNTPASKAPVAFPQKWYIWAAAASVTLIILITLLIPRGKADPGKLFMAYFQAPPTDRQILRNDKEADEKTQAFLSYEQGLYKEALAFYERALKEQTTHELLFYAGASALADGQSAKAVLYFTELLKNPHTLYQRRTQWYLSLAYLKEGQLEKTKALLNTLTQQPDNYQGKAKNLLEDLAD